MELNHIELVEGFRALGIKSGETTLVHSSLSSLGHVNGGPSTVIKALLDTVGLDGTVAVPTLTGKITDGVNEPPTFNVRATPCWTGKIPETLRTRPDARRSLHPTHSVAAVGAQSDAFVTGHETGSSPCDENSPYYKTCTWGGSIVLIGVDQNSNTTIHCCEEVAQVPYHLQPDVIDIPMTDYHGSTVVIRNRLHRWDKPPTDFNLFEPVLIDKKILTAVRIGNAVVRRLKANEMFEVMVDILVKNPTFLLKQ